MNLFSKFLMATLFTLSFSAFADFIKIPYELPDRENNWISYIASSDPLLMVYHNKGISVSNDQGLSFVESHFDSDLDFTRDMNPFIYVGGKTKTILLTVGHELYISKDLGLNFKRVKIDFRHYGINSLAMIDNDIFFTGNWGYSESCDNNQIFVMNTQGDVAKKSIPFNDSHCYMSSSLLIFDQKIYVQIFNEGKILYSRSTNLGQNFESIDPKQDKGYQLAYAEKNRLQDILARVLAKHNLPDFTVSENKLNHGSQSIIYNQSLFNPRSPTPGIAYEFEKDGVTSYLSSETAPRMALIDGKILYVASFRDLWVKE